MKVTPDAFKMALLGAGLAIFGAATAVLAATANVQVGSGGALKFTPAVVNINPGDQVTWTWESSGHDVDSETGAWTTSPFLSPGNSYTVTFNTAGSFPYKCDPHVSFGMTGEVVVAVSILPPTVSLTNPAAGSVFAAPANVTLQASAAASSGTVTNVQFLAGTSLVANVTAAPFTAVANNLAAGSYTLSAIAMDNNGTAATNQVPITVVTPVPVLASAPQRVAPGQFRFSFTGNTGLSYFIQSSTNLFSPTWTTLATNQATSGSIDFTDLNATQNTEFYRVGRLPNP